MDKSYKNYFLVTAIIFLMALTRNSHSLTSLNLPDATVALFFIAGLHFKKFRWFIFFFLISTLIDVITSYLDPSMNLWRNASYIGMLFAYGAMWAGGVLTEKNKSFIYFFITTSLSSILAFIISTQTYNLMSGNLTDITIRESLQMGWEYLPQSLIYTMSYLMAYWGVRVLLKKQFVSQKASI